MVTHGTRFGRLAYVVLEHGEGNSVRSRIMSSSDEHRLLWRDRGGVALPGELQFYEVINGVEFRSEDGDITLAEFRAYMQSAHQTYRIDDLQTFVHGSRADDVDGW